MSEGAYYNTNSVSCFYYDAIKFYSSRASEIIHTYKEQIENVMTDIKLNKF